MNRKLLVALIFTGMFFGACGAPTENDDSGDGSGEEFVFDEEDQNDNEGDEGEEFIFDEEDIPDKEEIVFDDDEGSEVIIDGIPIAGRWTITHHAGQMECPNVPPIDIPAGSQEIVTIDWSEDGTRMTLTTSEGVIILAQIAYNREGEYPISVYEGTIIVADIEIDYTLDYNFESYNPIRRRHNEYERGLLYKSDLLGWISGAIVGFNAS